MAINSVTSNDMVGKTAYVSSNDMESKRLQNQIVSKQQQLNSIESDEERTAEEKAKESREIQEQIAELNRKLQLKKQEEDKEAKKVAEESANKVIIREDVLKEVEKEEAKKEAKETDDEKLQEKRDDIKLQDKEASVRNIHNILAADSLVQKERVQGNVSRQKEGYENVLESEIKSDKLYGEDTTEKQKELKESIHSQDVLVKSGDSELAAAGIQVGGKIIIRE